jgi:hypothetical protein
LQNQNEETPAVYHLKDANTTASPGQYSRETLSPAAAAATAAGSSSCQQQQQLTAAGSSGRLGSRLTKSASWFNSLSRRRVSSTGSGAGGKPPLKKRSFAAFNASHRAADDSFATPSRPRLNK